MQVLNEKKDKINNINRLREMEFKLSFYFFK